MIAYLRSIMVLPNLQKRASDYEPEQKDIWWQMERKRGRRKQPAQHVATIGYDTSYLKKVEEGWKTAPVTLEQAAKGFFDFYSKFAFHEHIISIRVGRSLGGLFRADFEHSTTSLSSGGNTPLSISQQNKLHEQRN